MINKKKGIVIDIDGTVCPIKKPKERYEDVKPFPEMVSRIKEYKNKGFYITIYTSRQMRTHEGNLGRINATTAKTLIKWLDEHGIPYDEIYFGKPWQGEGGFYVDDKTIRPNEFIRMSYEEIIELIGSK